MDKKQSNIIATIEFDDPPVAPIGKSNHFVLF